MTDPPAKTSLTLSVDEFIALNDEIASLLQAGVPLDVGLSGYATAVSGRLSQVSGQVAEAVSRGESLETAIDSTSVQMPAAYRAILQAGAESGRLSQAVESLADHARRLRETRRQLRLALIYPTIVIILAWCLFSMIVSFITPRSFALALQAADEKPDWVMTAEKISTVFNALGPFPPLILIGFLIWILLPIRTSSRQAMLDFRGIRWIPGVHKARKAWNLSAFHEFSANLLQHGVPEPRALQLAAETTSDRALMADVRTVAEALERGEPAAARIDEARSFPAFMKWMWKVGEQQSAVAPTFRQLSEHFGQQAENRIARLQLLFPVAVTVFVAGSVVALYALAIFTPIVQLMLDISLESL